MSYYKKIVSREFILELHRYNEETNIFEEEKNIYGNNSRICKY